jgi:hypothetical protein
MKSRARSTVLIANIVLLAALIVIAQSHNGNAVGTWKLDTQKSDFGGMPAPKDLIVVVTEDTKDKVSWKLSGSGPDGKPLSESFSGAVDGKPHAIGGSERGESVAYTRDPDGTFRSVTTDKSGAEVAHSTVTLSDDGSTMTIKNTRKTPNGDVNYTEVFTKSK